MLFYCVWSDRASMLLDVDDLEVARAAATEENGAPPKRVVPFAGILGAHVNFEEDGTMTMDPLPHVFDALGALEDQLTADIDAEGGRELAPVATCASEAEDDAGKVVRCVESAGHLDEHRSACGLVWPNERAAGKVA